MSTFKKARSERNYFGTKAKEQRKRNRAISFSQSDAHVLSSRGYFKIQALHAMFLNKAFGVDPKKYLGESQILKRLTA